MRKLVLILFLGLVGTVALFGGKLALFAFQPLRAGTQDSFVVEVRKGQGPVEITKALAKGGAVADSDTFVWVGRLARQWKRVRAGEYQLSAAMSPMQIFETLASGISLKHPVTVREGENTYEIGADMEAKGLVTKAEFLRLCRDPKLRAALKLDTGRAGTLEGYLFPETYFFNKSQTPEEMIRQMVKRFTAAWTEKEQARAKQLGLTQHEVVTLASMIEKETGAQKERPLISSVFHNRLAKKMRLQSDPTTIYGIWNKYKGNLHRDDLTTPSDYNTYTVAALPIGPIGNPGQEAIQAALHPETSEFIFFVSHNDGTHEFTRSLNEHVNAVKKFQLDPQARQGKSWRDLSRAQQDQKKKSTPTAPASVRP
jgi:UPF0755 protein